MYRWLLRLYPASFRNEYGREMAAVFARERRDTRTALGMAALWLRVIADTCVNAAGIHWDILRQDLRYTLRTLRRTPAFALTAVTVVALGIGATTAGFSLADFVLIRPLPFPEADRLVRFSEERPGFPRMELAPANYRDLKQMATSFEALGAYRGLSVNLVTRSRSCPPCARSSNGPTPRFRCRTSRPWSSSSTATWRRASRNCAYWERSPASPSCWAESAFMASLHLPCLRAFVRSAFGWRSVHGEQTSWR